MDIIGKVDTGDIAEAWHDMHCLYGLSCPTRDAHTADKFTRFVPMLQRFLEHLVDLQARP